MTVVHLPRRYRFLAPAIRDGEAGLERVRRAQANAWKTTVFAKLAVVVSGALVGLALVAAVHGFNGETDLIGDDHDLTARRLADECVSTFNPFRDGKLQTKGTALCSDALGYIPLTIAIMIYMFWTLAIVVDEDFVSIMDYIVKETNIDEDVAGATLMAAGGSAPEFFTSLISVFELTGTGFGTIVGSAIFNILAVIAACAYFARPRQEVVDRREGRTPVDDPWPWEPLPLTWWPLLRDSTSYVLGLFVLALFYFCSSDGLVSGTCNFTDGGYILTWEAVILFVMYILYCFLMVVQTPIKIFIEKHMSFIVPKAQRGIIDGESDADSTATDIETSRPSQAEPKTTTYTPKLKLAQVQESHRELPSETDRDDDSVENASNQGSSKSLVVTSTTRNLRWSSSARNLPSEGSRRSFRGYRPGGEAMSRVDSAVSSQGAGTDIASAVYGGDMALAQSEVIKEMGDEDDDVEVVAPRMRPTRWMHFNGDRPWYIVIVNNLLYILVLPVLFANCTVYFNFDTLDTVSPRFRPFAIVYGFFMSLVWIAIYTWLMVFAAETFGDTIGMPDTVLGFTILAAGTSCPDLLSSVFVSKLGYGDMAVSSSIGSNIFDILVGLPIPWLISNLYTGTPLPVETGAVAFSLAVIIMMIVSLIIIIIWQDWKLTLLGAKAMLLLYFVFLICIIAVEMA
ncbi:Sodium/potassium/calcium exchanger 2 [Hondaea fermentalgiana]|uniref:Sodium/potassium/calcium exchanger 2 n=1 Tax=Hondaea fermentalgiana TaxID=2315210 RepID=A0A2R5G1Q4_9STRA|nr:Sodium/potassium/calcium exchanger 2 [Hondaea fermentalgiana]|eukprot:GBG24922.1 Sodium/potassium/calcium exchanger 2 [Hondaea fermentalgiana]